MHAADNAEMRRGLKALNSVFGNKIAILAGDFLLARASVSLAALRDSEVIQLLSQVIEDLVTGEILQVCANPSFCCLSCSAHDLIRPCSFVWITKLVASQCKGSSQFCLLFSQSAVQHLACLRVCYQLQPPPPPLVGLRELSPGWCFVCYR